MSSPPKNILCQVGLKWILRWSDIKCPIVTSELSPKPKWKRNILSLFLQQNTYLLYSRSCIKYVDIVELWENNDNQIVIYFCIIVDSSCIDVPFNTLHLIFYHASTVCFFHVQFLWISNSLKIKCLLIHTHRL